MHVIAKRIPFVIALNKSIQNNNNKFFTTGIISVTASWCQRSSLMPPNILALGPYYAIKKIHAYTNGITVSILSDNQSFSKPSCAVR